MINNDIKNLAKQNELKAMLSEDFMMFVKYMYKAYYRNKWMQNWHHDKIAEHLTAVYKGEIQKLIINLPPSHSKSVLVSEMFPAWGFFNNTMCRFLNISYSINVALRNSFHTKEIIKTEQFQALQPLKVKFNADSKQFWETTKNGMFYAASSEGQITGMHAGQKIELNQETGKYKFCGAVLIDDPIKVDDSSSDYIIQKINDNFEDTISSRVNTTRTPFIVIMQRLHENDLSGYLLNTYPGKWEHLKIPAIDEEGKALWPVIKSERDLIQIKRANPRLFNSQYQQDPTPTEGNIFLTEYFRYFEKQPETFEYKIAVADIATDEKSYNDYTVIQVWGKLLSKAYLIDQIRIKVQLPEVKEIITRINEIHQPKAFYIEKNNAGVGVIQDLRKTTSIPIHEIFQHKSKVQRVNAIIHHFGSNSVVFPSREMYDWVDCLIAELKTFPNSKHDDQVDAVSLALANLFEFSGLIVYPEFDATHHIRPIEFNPQLKSILVFNMSEKPALIFAQYDTFNQQLKILDVMVSDKKRPSEFIMEFRSKQATEYAESLRNFLLLGYKDYSEEFNPFDFELTVKEIYGRFPISDNSHDATDYIINDTAKLLNSVTPSTEIPNKIERKLMINTQCSSLIYAMSGGLTYKTDSTSKNRTQNWIRNPKKQLV